MPARKSETDGPRNGKGHGRRPPRKRETDGPHDHNGHGHKPHDPPYFDPDYEHPPDHDHEPPDNPRYPDPRIYGRYASKRPPRYVPHPFEHACFKPRKEDYKPPTTCDGDDDELCIRKDHRRLTVDEQNRFLNAFTQINAMNALGPLVDIHSNAIHQMHNDPRFLPWHRVYLLRMEELLMAVDPTVCIPYWKSSEEQAFPSWLLGFTPTVNLISGPHTVTRNIGVFAVLPNAAAVAAAMANGTFNPFASALEGVHNSGHVWVDGSMGGISTAPTDPVFWMHHAEIDRIWAEWQEANPGQNPPLAGAAATMDPWTETEADTRDITALGYSYA
jgi:tyrosinase